MLLSNKMTRGNIDLHRCRGRAALLIWDMGTEGGMNARSDGNFLLNKHRYRNTMQFPWLRTTSMDPLLLDYIAFLILLFIPPPPPPLAPSIFRKIRDWSWKTISWQYSAPLMLKSSGAPFNFRPLMLCSTLQSMECIEHLANKNIVHNCLLYAWHGMDMDITK